MKQSRLLIVEDEVIVAHDLQYKLQKMGYDVPAISASGAEALSILKEQRPDLVLTDIRLGTQPDGIELARLIRADYDLPVIFLTAFSDDDTLARAQITEPYGYILKPFHDRELQIAIEIAVYKHRMERELRENRSWLSAVLLSIGEGVIATDVGGRIVFLNPTGEALTGWRQADARGQSLGVIFKVLLRKNVFSPWVRFSHQDYLQSDYFNETVLVSKSGKECLIRCSFSRMKDEHERQIGEVIIFRETSARESPFLPVLR